MAEQHGHHHHNHSLNLKQVNHRSFIIGITLNILFVVTELIAGFWNGSMALLTDAGHNASDVASLVLSLFALRLARRNPTETYTYGYKKTTILAALANAVILLIAIGVLGYESITRLRHPVPVPGGTIAWVAGLGILVNSISAYLFYKNKEQDLNVKSAYLHLLADALVSIGVVIGGVLITYTGMYWIDPVIGLIVMMVILVSTWSLLRDSFRMAVDAVPAGVSVAEVTAVISRMPDVTDVSHVHIWSLSTTENALTAQVLINDQLSFEDKIKVVRLIKHELEHHNIHHSTIELAATKRSNNCQV